MFTLRVEPYRYHSVTVTTESSVGFIEFMESKPPDFFSRRLKAIRFHRCFHSLSGFDGSQTSLILRGCPSISHLADWGSSIDILPAGRTLRESLLSLSTSLGSSGLSYLCDGGVISYPNLTHLDIRDPPIYWRHWSWKRLGCFPHLTHISLNFHGHGYLARLPIVEALREVLSHCRSIKICILVDWIHTADDAVSSAEASHFLVSRGLEDKRIVHLIRNIALGPDEWEAHVRGLRCFWDEAEDILKERN